MTLGIAVSDASPLISLSQIQHIHLLRNVFTQVVVPPAIELEVMPSVGPLPHWVERQHIHPSADFLHHLDPGEREAIALALELNADFLVIDDLPGRRAAELHGLRVVGTWGTLVMARRRGLVNQVRPLMDALMNEGLFVSEQIYGEILVLAGEEPSLGHTDSR